MAKGVSDPRLEIAKGGESTEIDTKLHHGLRDCRRDADEHSARAEQFDGMDRTQEVLDHAGIDRRHPRAVDDDDRSAVLLNGTRLPSTGVSAVTTMAR